MIYALTIRQPWAALIAYGDKRVENRVWASQYRGPLLIHAGKTLDTKAMRLPLVASALRALRARGVELTLGAVIAVADLDGYHAPDHEDEPCSPWAFPDHVHFDLGQVLALPKPVSCSGRQKLWKPSEKLLQRIRVQLSDEQAGRFLREEAAAC
ncbi:ASCH domain-containing protein [Streptomyces rugosispiralis]|uniref:ASCH domain-containing protein n=1 Tax=Streptomyces rugosispiralis TaxID=2967341 RepID=A0ABT1VD18_9ACTN|nr:ASCH domain-containing protein [Streptomyces rugosispiralis]MCQ8194669.1 ASCH domain-containing protein [Streptomyces rugosispiralis]